MKIGNYEVTPGAIAITALFAANSLQVVLIAGPVKIKHVLVLSLLAYISYQVVLKENFKLRASQELQVFAILYVVCIIVMLLNGLMFAPSPDYMAGFSEFAYLLPLFFATYHFFDTYLEVSEKFLRSVAMLLYVSMFGFILFFAARANIDVLGALKDFSTGQVTLQSKIFAATFVYLNDDSGAAARHTMMYMFFILLVLIRAAREIDGDPTQRAPFTWVEGLLVLTVALIGMSRKVVLSLLIYWVLYYFISRRFVASKSSFGIAKTVVLVAVSFVGLIVVLGSVDSGALDLFWHRYVSKVIENQRINQYVLSIVDVTSSFQSVVFGVGLGEKIAGDPHYPHNILFYFFHQMGLIGLAAGLALYAFLGLLMLRSLYIAVYSDCRNAAYLALASLACYLVPFTRMTVGDGGRLAMEGSLGLMLGMVLLNRAMHAARHQPVLVRPVAAPA